MRIDKIKNFKGFSNEEFDLNPRFTVFIGNNAKRKTSVLDALAVSIGSYLRGIDVAKHEARGIDKKEVRVKTVEGQPRPQLPVEIEAFGEVHGKTLSEGWKRSVNKLTIKTTTTFVNAKNIETLASEMLQKSRENGKITFPVIAYHGTGRLWAEHEEKKAPYKKQGEGVEMAYIKCLSPKSSSKEFISWYKTYEDEVKKFGSKTDQLLLDTFKQAIISMIPGEQWTNMSYSFKDDDLVGFFKNEDQVDKLLFGQLSDGYRNLIGMVADIAYRCIMLNPHLGADAVRQTPGIVLIDELDLHLHPNWQKRIVSDLKNVFQNIQFIATTHSPFIVQSLHNNELIDLEGKNIDDDYLKIGIEDIAEGEMGVQHANRSRKFIEMQKVADEYYRLIESGTRISDADELNRLEIRLNKLMIPFYNDPAYVSYLKSFQHLLKKKGDP